MLSGFNRGTVATWKTSQSLFRKKKFLYVEETITDAPQRF